MTCILYALGEETNPRTKFGEIEQSTRRGGILCLIVISLCPSYFDSPMLHIACVLLSLRWSYVYCSWCACFIVTLSTWLLFLCYWYMSTPHHIFLYVSCWQTTPYCRWVTFISYLSKLSWICMALEMLWLYCVRGVPPRTRVVLLMKLCEGSPPKITYGTYWWWLQCGKRYMHVTCRIHKLFMPLHAAWCFPKFPAICPPVVKCF